MNKRLVKIKAYQVILKRRCKRMKAMEKKLGKIEKEMKEIKEKEKEKDNYEGFDYQSMDYEWDGQRNDSNADMVEPEGQKIDEKESEEEPEVEAEEAEKDDIGSEEEKEPDEVAEEAEKNDIGSEGEKEPEAEVEAEEDKEKEDEEDEKEPDEVETEKREARVEVETEKTKARVEVETEKTEARVEVVTEKTPTPSPGRTKAAAARRALHTTPKKLFTLSKKLQKRVEDEIMAEKMVENEVEEPEAEAKEMVEDEVEEPEKEAVKYTEEEKQEWYMVVYETKEADEGAAKPAGTEGAPKRRGRPRKATESKKFTTPEPTKRIRSRSQWVSTPFTEAGTDEIEGHKKKKPRTKA
ncbi:hypothetical protein Bca52824_022897 [Brassica carinata]|uniref:Uncharacterized protein n=1 Tax=Brassica carinata TaxID=52824 RepID=A0A8X7VHZ0_BRACI|nr:hypothetical protein Bca52824_022897 [Brassica carinata]